MEFDDNREWPLIHASFGTVDWALPIGDVHFDDDRVLQQFDAEISRMSPHELRERYMEIYEDADLYYQTRTLFRNWTSAGNAASRQRLMDSWSKVANLDIARMSEPNWGFEMQWHLTERLLFNLISTRKERWRRLSNRHRLANPASFRLYRGVKGGALAREIYNRWMSRPGNEMHIPVHVLSSWSMKRETALEFAGQTGAGQTGVLYEAIVPIHKTLADKWLDDGSFVSGPSGECEVIVATNQPDTIMALRDKISVFVSGREFKYDQNLRPLDLALREAGF